jgi:hypothetical protein
MTKTWTFRDSAPSETLLPKRKRQLPQARCIPFSSKTEAIKGSITLYRPRIPSVKCSRLVANLLFSSSYLPSTAPCPITGAIRPLPAWPQRPIPRADNRFAHQTSILRLRTELASRCGKTVRNPYWQGFRNLGLAALPILSASPWTVSSLSCLVSAVPSVSMAVMVRQDLPDHSRRRSRREPFPGWHA